MKVEEEHQDVLPTIEFAIVDVYRSRDDLIAAEVLNAIQALGRTYGADA